MDELYNPDDESRLVAAALADFQYFALPVLPADFHDTQLGYIWGIGQELVELGDFADRMSLQDAAERRGVSVDAALDRLQLLGMDLLLVDAPIFAHKVKDLADRRQADSHLVAARKALYTSNGTWRADAAGPLTALSAELARSTTQPVQRITSWSAAELLAAQFPEPQWAVPGLIPVGLTILGGRPKVGKSWLALQIAIAAGTGGMALDRQVKQGRVLYMALEDNGRRLQERTAKQGMPSWAAIHFETVWPRLTDGGIEQLDAAIAEHKYTFVIIDTLGRAVGRARTDDYGDMTDLLGRLQDIAMLHDMALLVLDHHRKSSGQSSDPIDDIIGSTAKSGTADGALGLSKENGKRGAILSVDGRDILKESYALSWDAITCCWQLEGTAEEVKLSGRRGDILAALRESGEPMSCMDLARTLDLDKRNVQPILNDLVNDGLLERLPKQGRDIPYQLRNV